MQACYETQAARAPEPAECLQLTPEAAAVVDLLRLELHRQLAEHTARLGAAFRGAGAASEACAQADA